MQEEFLGAESLGEKYKKCARPPTPLGEKSVQGRVSWVKNLWVKSHGRPNPCKKTIHFWML